MFNNLLDFQNIQNHFLLVGIILGILGLVLLVRLVKGPHIIDRVLAADCIEVTSAFIMVMFGCFITDALYIDLALVLALLGFIGTVLISKYLEGKL